LWRAILFIGGEGPDLSVKGNFFPEWSAGFSASANPPGKALNGPENGREQAGMPAMGKGNFCRNGNGLEMEKPGGCPPGFSEL
jgi:hypothetical protein